MSVTIKDIAKRVGVTSGTVSYALNGKGRISEDIRNQIMQVAAELGYIPNRNARNLVKKVKGRIGLFIPNIEYLKSSIFFNNLVAGIMSVVNDTENDLLLDLSKDNFENLLDGAMDVDGAIVLHPRNDSTYYNLLNKCRIPFLIVGRPVEQFENQVTYVDLDNVAISYNVTKMLISRGHRCIAAVLGEKDYTITVDQTEGLKIGLKEAGIEFKEDLIINKDYIIHGRMEELNRLITENKNITAVITASDTQAISVMNELERMNISVPQDISVACLAGTYLTQYYHPSISGVSNPSFDIGRIAANKIIDVINRKNIRPTHTIVDFNFFEGASVDNLNKI